MTNNRLFFSNSLRSSLYLMAKVLMARWAMKLLHLRPPMPCHRGAHIVLYHEVPADTAQQFRQHLAYISRTYEVVSLDRLTEALRQGHSVDGWLAITFDDGFKDNMEVAAPLLREFELTACFFVTTGFVSLDAGDMAAYQRFARDHFRRPDVLPAMTWDDLRTLRNQGFTIGSHTRTHRDLALLPQDEAIIEVSGSRRDIEQHLGDPPAYFAWPFGRFQNFPEPLRRNVGEVGYVAYCSAVRGPNVANTSPYALRRDHLEPDWPLVLVRFFLEGGHDWLRRQLRSVL